jgi:hypothetical protein
MERKNLLLGNGELLTYPIDAPKTSSKKKHPYSFSEARDRLLPKVESVLKKMRDIPDNAKPRGEEVAKFTLHPAYMAKSYYPDSLLRKCGLRSVGSKEVSVKPSKTTRVGEPEYESSSCLYISGTQGAFEAFLSHLDEGDFPVGVKNDIIKLEDISFYESSEKIKSVDKNVKWLDVALHATSDDVDIVKSFSTYVKSLNGLADTKRRIVVGGLTFLPVKISYNQIDKLADFSLLRIVRSMPKLRMENPSAFRTITSTSAPTMPDDDAQNEDIKVAIFDGGIGANDFDSWVTEHNKTGHKTSHAGYLQHGCDVTSAFLFGRVRDGQTELPIPYTNVDHYRVIDHQSGSDPDLYDILLRIKSVLDDRKHSYINLSLGPQIPIEDDDIHVWTSTLEHYLSDGQVLATVAVGNDGDKPAPLSRIQPPSDMVNALAVGAADSIGDDWKRAPYSSVGPGRSPGVIKPDGVMFGGVPDNPFNVFSPWGGVAGVCGTSFSSPLTLRSAVAVAASLDHPITPIAVKALLIHHTKKNSEARTDVGWGCFPENIDEIITCSDDEATLIYQGVLTAGQWLKAPIPFPSIELNGDVTLTATFCYASKFDPEHPVNYTRSGIEVTFRKNSDGETTSFFTNKNLYPTEQDLRRDGHKWETSLHHSRKFRKTSLDHPSFDVVYRAREGGKGVPLTDLEPLPYALIVTLKANNTPDLYNNILQRYPILQPVQVRGEAQIRT